MKKYQLSVILIVLLFACFSCQMSYQLIKVESNLPKADSLSSNPFQSENSEIKIMYDFWGHGGSTTFKVYNKTTKIIYLNLKSCHFIINNQSKDYYVDYTETSSSSYSLGSYKQQQSGRSNSDIISGGHSITYRPKPVIEIPPNSYIEVPGFQIISSELKKCFGNGLDYSQQHRAFTKENTPLLFKNYISYGIMESDLSKIVIDEFWVTDISYMESGDFIHIAATATCDHDAGDGVFVYYSPNRFYFHFTQK